MNAEPVASQYRIELTSVRTLVHVVVGLTPRDTKSQCVGMQPCTRSRLHPGMLREENRVGTVRCAAVRGQPRQQESEDHPQQERRMTVSTRRRRHCLSSQPGRDPDPGRTGGEHTFAILDMLWLGRLPCLLLASRRGPP